MIFILTSDGVSEVRALLDKIADHDPVVLSARTGLRTSHAAAATSGEERPRPKLAPAASSQVRGGRRPGDISAKRLRSLLQSRLPERLHGLLESVLKESHALRVPPIDGGVTSLHESALNRVLEEVDSSRGAVLLAADPGTYKLAWRVSRLRPETLVLAHPEVAVSTLEVLAERGMEMSPSVVRRLLDPGRVPPPVSHHFRELRRSGRPRVVSVVSNSVDGDSRVQKVAASLARLGYESILLGRHPGDRQDAYLQGGALVLRERIPSTGRLIEREAPPRDLLAIAAFRSAEEAKSSRRRARARSRMAAAALASEPVGTLRHRAIKQVERAQRFVVAARLVQFRRNRERFFALRGDPSIETVRPWIRPIPSKLSGWAMRDDLELGFGPILERLRPDVIHAHDSDTLLVAVHAAKRLRSAGLQTRIVYDAHEYTPGIARGHARQRTVLTEIERRGVPECAAVITVSQPIAQLLSIRHSLLEQPTVVTNSPDARFTRPVETVRERLHLGRSIPLLVYVGSVAPQRGADLAVMALAELPGVHLAIVARESSHTRKLEHLANQLAVAERVHRFDYVPAEDVVAFLRGSHAGLIPFRRLPNSSLGLPTKYREYALAGLPIVASDEGLVAKEVRKTGIGELFETNSASSLAMAISRVLADHESYTKRITKDLKEEYSWERQEVELEKVYSRVAPLNKPVSPSPVEVSPAPSVLIGRTNSAGQAERWASSLRASGIQATSLQVVRDVNEYQFHAGVTVAEGDWSRRETRLRAFVDLVPNHTHAVLESGVPVFGLDASEIADMESLTRSGLQVAVALHGSDVRSPSRHAAREPWSPFREPANRKLAETLQNKASRLQRALADFPGAVFVSTPDLLDELPWAKWLPVVVDTDAFAPGDQWAGENAVPVVMHAPSLGALKGTRFIEPVLTQLHREGLIEYRRIPRVPNSEMPGLIRSADILVDQVLMNLMGVAAAEAMACGRVVIAHVSEGLARRYPTEPPVVDATPDTLERVLRQLLADRERMGTLGRLGREFAKTVHDGRLAAQVLIEGLALDVPDPLR